MKKNKTSVLAPLLVVFGVLICPLVTSAQTKTANRIIFTFGGGAVPEILEETSELTEAIFSDGTRNSETAFSGAFSLQYDRSITEKISAGVSLTFEAIEKDVTIPGSGTTIEGAYKAKYFTVLANASYIYKSNPKLEMYARVAIGATQTNEEYTEQQPTIEDNDVLLAYQISPIGVRVGQRLFFQAEAGFGYVGILSFGVGYRF